MDRLQGETGASPVLSRNCDEGIPLSQVARSKVFTTLSLKGGGDFGLATVKLQVSPPWQAHREVLLSKTDSQCERIPVYWSQWFEIILERSILKRYASLPFVWILLLVVLTACAPVSATPEAAPLVLTDGLGREVSLESTPQRIVSLAPSTTEILFAVSAGPQVVGRDEFSNYPEEALALASVGGSMGDYNLEQIVSLKPDLVLAAEINTPEQVKALEELGLNVYYLSNPTDVEGVYDLVTTTGQLTGHAREAAALVEDLTARVEAVKEKAARAETKPRVFYELDGSDPAKPWTAGSGTFIDQLIRLAGGENVGASLEGAWGQFSQEALLVADPEFILLGDAAYGTTPEQVAARPGWDAITAVKNGNILPFNDDTVSRPGPRLVDALEELFRVLHPELP